jgi:hypothetical protein
MRDRILATWNARFWLIVSRDVPVFTTEAMDVHSAIAEWLTYIASTPDVQPYLTPLCGVSIDGPDGPWTTLPIGPAYRQAPEATRIVVRRLLESEFPAIADEWLERGDVETYETWRSANEARLQASEGHER